VIVSFVCVVACRLFAFVLLLARSDRSKELGIVLLRHELSILRRQARRPKVLRLARENCHWGYVRIVGELRKLGIAVSATLVRNVLHRAGVPPAGARPLQLAGLLAPEARSSPVTLSPSTQSGCGGCTCCSSSRSGHARVEYIACASKPDTAWMIPQAPNLLMTSMTAAGGRASRSTTVTRSSPADSKVSFRVRA
jgi:hypothetical protein